MSTTSHGAYTPHTPNDLNLAVIEEFRARQGRVGGPFEGSRLILLTTTGARTGRRHTTPLGSLIDGPLRRLVIASAGGGPRHPDWYHNLCADPVVTVEDGVFTYEAEASVLAGGERERAFERAVEADPGWADYQAKTDRTLPVIALTAVDGRPNATSGGEALRQVHGAFRRELALIRGELARAVALDGDGEGERDGGGTGARLGAQLRINCLTVCHGLSHHHTTEDTGLFPVIDEQHPDLVPVIERLRREHVAVGRLVGELEELLAGERSRPGPDPAVVLAAVERLTGELEAHLDYEEDHVVPVLDRLSAPGEP